MSKSLSNNRRRLSAPAKDTENDVNIETSSLSTARSSTSPSLFAASASKRRYFLVAFVVLLIVLLIAFNVWLRSLPSPVPIKWVKRLTMIQMAVLFDVIAWCLLYWYLWPLLFQRPAWSEDFRRISRALYALFAACLLSVQPINRIPLLKSLVSPGADADGPGLLVLFIFTSFGVFLVLLVNAAIADGASRALDFCVSRWSSYREQRVKVGTSGDVGGSFSYSPPASAASPARAAATSSFSATAASAPSVVASAPQFGVRWSSAVLISTALITLLGLREAALAPAIVRISVPLLRLPPALHGFKIVQLSDVHVGPTVGSAHMRELVAAANALEGDLIAITGDILDGDEEDYAALLAPLGGLRTRVVDFPLLPVLSPAVPPIMEGREVFACSGNHDHYEGTFRAKVAIFRALNITLLLNERIKIPRRAADDGDDAETFDLIGVTDWSAGGMSQRQQGGGEEAGLVGAETTASKAGQTAETSTRRESTAGDFLHTWEADLATAVRGLDLKRESVLLAHQPKQAPTAALEGIGLQLSGHTHGGQIFPLHVGAWALNPFFAGEYRSIVDTTPTARGGGVESRGGAAASKYSRAGAAVEATKALAAEIVDAQPHVLRRAGSGSRLFQRLAETAERAVDLAQWSMELYVSRGSVYWGPPLRFLAPKEITLVTLLSAEHILKEQGGDATMTQAQL